MEIQPTYIGIAAGVFTAVSQIPQLVRIFKKKKADDLSYSTLFTLLAGLVTWVWYGIIKNDYPLIVTNSFSVLVNLMVIIFSIRYKK